MNNFLFPLLEKFCPLSNILPNWGLNCPDRQVDFVHFQVQVRKRAVLRWAWGCFVFVHIPERCVWLLSKEQGLGVVFWANWDPIWAKWDPSRQFVLKVGKRALGEKIQSYSHPCCTFTLLSCLSIHYTAAFHGFTQLIKPHLAQCCFAGWKCCSTGTQNKCFDKDITRYWQVAHDIERLLLGMGACFSWAPQPTALQLLRLCPAQVCPELSAALSDEQELP